MRGLCTQTVVLNNGILIATRVHMCHGSTHKHSCVHTLHRTQPLSHTHILPHILNIGTHTWQKQVNIPIIYIVDALLCLSPNSFPDLWCACTTRLAHTYCVDVLSAQHSLPDLWCACTTRLAHTYCVDVLSARHWFPGFNLFTLWFAFTIGFCVVY